MSKVLDELQARGMIVQSTGLDALSEEMAQGPITYYCGFDPTAPSLHLGHLVQVITLRRLQEAGNRPLALVGGATGLIGDPRMTGERTLNPREMVAEWVERLRAQIEPFLDFDGEYAATMVNNYDWISELNAITLLRDIGKHFRMSTMLAKDTVARRLASDDGISYTEFSYQILQSIDFSELHKRYGCLLQTGGNDQWGNLTAGVEFIRKESHTSVHAFTTPLITKADGTKFGKSEGGAIWLDPEMTSPYAFYQYWLNSDDRDVIGYLKVFSFRSLEEISELQRLTEERPGAREAQRTLAHDVTSLVHGEEATAAVMRASQALFGREDLGSLDERTLAGAVAELPRAPIGGEHPAVVDLFVESGLAQGKGAARRTIAEGGAYLNNVKVTDPDAQLSASDLLYGRWALLRRGRKTLAVAEKEK